MSGYPGGRLSGLLTDLYELTMAAGYVQKHFEARATFELFVRHLPPHRNYLVAAGLEQALDLLGVSSESQGMELRHTLGSWHMKTKAKPSAVFSMCSPNSPRCSWIPMTSELLSRKS